MRYAAIEQKLFARSRDAPNGCLEWTAGKDKCGYGRIWYKNKNSTAHTTAYEAWIGEIPEGMHVLHTCDNPSCIHPDHLKLGTHLENMEDKVRRGRVSGEKNPNHKSRKIKC